MTDMQNYTREYFVHSEQQKQKDALKKIGRQTFVDLQKEKKLTNCVFNYDVLIGSKQDAIKKFSELEKSLKNKGECDLINKFGGIENVFDIIDKDGDGIITGQELKDVAGVDTADEWAVKKSITLSANDLAQLYVNLVNSEDAVVEENGNKTVYKYKDNLKTTIKKDDTGNVIEQRNEKISKNNQKTVTLYNFEKQMKTERVYDSQKRIISEEINNKGTLEDRKSVISYSEDGSITTKFESIGQKIEWTNDKKGNITAYKRELKYQSDGFVGDTKQNNIGDCWLLATVNSMKDTPVGAKILKDSIKQNDDGSVTVTLKGVNRSYTYSPERIAAKEYNNEGKVYSSGDIDMKLIELAVKDYRKELLATKSRDYIDREISERATENDPLRAGYFSEPVKYLTGLNAKATSKYSNKIDILFKKNTNPDNYAITVMFKSKDSSIGISEETNKTVITTGHMYNVSRVTEDTVYVVNPWDSSKEIAYPKDKFLDNSSWMSLTDLSQFS